MLYFLLCGLHCHIKKQKQHAFNILDRDHPEFKCLFHTCDNYIRKLHTEGVGAETHAAEILIPEEESKLWDNVFLSRCTKKTVECSLLLQWEELSTMWRS